MDSAVLLAVFAVECFACASESADRSKADHWAFKAAAPLFRRQGAAITVELTNGLGSGITTTVIAEHKK